MTRQKRDPVDPDDPTRFQPWFELVYMGHLTLYLLSNGIIVHVRTLFNVQ